MFRPGKRGQREGLVWVCLARGMIWSGLSGLARYGEARRGSAPPELAGLGAVWSGLEGLGPFGWAT